MSPPTAPAPGRPASAAGGPGAYQIPLIRVTLEPGGHERAGHHEPRPGLPRPVECRLCELSGDSVSSSLLRNASVRELDRPIVETAVAELGVPALHLHEEAALTGIVLDVHREEALLVHRRSDTRGPASTRSAG